MPRPLRTLTCFTLSLLLSMAASAQMLESTDGLDVLPTEIELQPYEARVEVAGQSDIERTRGMSTGLQEVIVSLLGSEDALYEPQIERALRTPQQYIMQYSYEREEQAGEVLTLLRMRFSPHRVDDLLRAADQIETGELQSLDIDVDGIRDFAAYATTMTALRNLAMVREVSPGMVQPGRVEFRLQFEGDIQKFTTAVEEQTELRPMDSTVDPIFADRLSYELR